MNTTNTSPLGKMSMTSNKTSGPVTLTADMDKFKAALEDPTYFKAFFAQYMRNALNLNGEAWRALQKPETNHDEWLKAICLETVRVTDKDKQEAAAQFHKVAPLLAQVDEKGKAQYFAMVELEPFTTEAEMAISFAKQRMAIAAKAAAESLAAKMKQADALASLLKPQASEPPKAK